MSEPAPAQALTFEEARARLKVGRSTLFRMVAPDAKDPIPSVRIGRSRRFLAEDVDAYLRAHRTKVDP